MRILSLLAAVLTTTGCLTGATTARWKATAVKSARFDTGCQQMQIVGTQADGASTQRYKIAGCGKTVIYICEDVDLRARKTGLELMVEGVRSNNTRCKPLR